MDREEYRNNTDINSKEPKNYFVHNKTICSSFEQQGIVEFRNVSSYNSKHTVDCNTDAIAKYQDQSYRAYYQGL